jgi:hypothetical protein
MERATGVEPASAGWKPTAQPALPDTLNERTWQPRLESNQRASVLETEPAPPPRGRLGGRGDSNSDLPIHTRASCQLNDRPHNGALRRRRADVRSLQRGARCASMQGRGHDGNCTRSSRGANPAHSAIRTALLRDAGYCCLHSVANVRVGGADGIRTRDVARDRGARTASPLQLREIGSGRRNPHLERVMSPLPHSSA